MTAVGILSPRSGRVTLALKGNLYAEMLPEVNRFIENNHALEKQVHLDLSEVRLLDREAARFLAEQSGRGVELVNCPLYLTLWISPH
jgi:ABC-type transporter Mla MlaB component